MIGPEGASEVVAELVTDRFTAKLDELIVRLDLDAGAEAGRGDLPYVNLTVITEPRPLGTFTVNEYPIVLVVAQNADRLEEVDRVAGGIVYLVRYPVRLFLFARGGSFDETDLRRKRYVLALREVLLQAQELLGLDPTSLRESYSDVGPSADKEVRTVAGAFIEATVTIEETLAPLDYVGIGEASYPAPAPDGWVNDVTTELLSHPEAD